jgi:hypothetical protein
MDIPREDAQDAQHWDEEEYAPFWFDAYSLVPLDTLKEQGFVLHEVLIEDGTGTQKTLIIPIYEEKPYG